MGLSGCNPNNQTTPQLQPGVAAQRSLNCVPVACQDLVRAPATPQPGTSKTWHHALERTSSPADQSSSTKTHSSSQFADAGAGARRRSRAGTELTQFCVEAEVIYHEKARREGGLQQTLNPHICIFLDTWTKIEKFPRCTSGPWSAPSGFVWQPKSLLKNSLKVMELSLQIYFFTAFVSCVKVRPLERVWQTCLIVLSGSLWALLIFLATGLFRSGIAQEASRYSWLFLRSYIFPYTGFGLKMSKTYGKGKDTCWQAFWWML